MLVFKSNQIVSVTAVESKPYDFNDEGGKNVKGTSIQAVVTAIGTGGQLAVIKVKGKTVEEAQRKLDGLKVQVGKPAEIQITRVAVGSGAVLQLSL